MSSRLLVAATALALCVGAAGSAAAENMPAVQIRVLDQGDAPVRVTAAEWAGANALRIRVGSDLSRGVSSTWVIVFVVRPDGYFAGSQVQLLNPLRGLLNPAGVAEGLVSLSEFQLREGSAVLVAIDRAATARGTWTRAWCRRRPSASGCRRSRSSCREAMGRRQRRKAAVSSGAPPNARPARNCAVARRASCPSRATRGSVTRSVSARGSAAWTRSVIEPARSSRRLACRRGPGRSPALRVQELHPEQREVRDVAPHERMSAARSRCAVVTIVRNARSPTDASVACA